MKRLSAVFLLLFLIFSNLHAQEVSSVAKAEEPALEHNLHMDYWLYGSVPVIIAAWGLGAWGWGTASDWHVDNDGWGLEQNSYTGGADKLGHAWGIYTVSRIGSFVFEAEGESKQWAAFKGFFFGQLMGFGIEVGDGFGDSYGFAWGDMLWNFWGGLIALAFDLYPLLDNLIGFQMEYWPSEDHRNQKPEKWIEVTSDVTGQKFIAALKFSGIPWVKDTFFQYFQIDFGYYTRGYWFPDSSYRYKTRHTYIGFAINLSRVSERVLPSGCWRKAFSSFFKYYHAPLVYNSDLFDSTLSGRTETDQ